MTESLARNSIIQTLLISFTAGVILLSTILFVDTVKNNIDNWIVIFLCFIFAEWILVLLYIFLKKLRYNASSLILKKKFKSICYGFFLACVFTSIILYLGFFLKIYSNRYSSISYLITFQLSWISFSAFSWLIQTVKNLYAKISGIDIMLQYLNNINDVLLNTGLKFKNNDEFKKACENQIARTLRAASSYVSVVKRTLHSSESNVWAAVYLIENNCLSLDKVESQYADTDSIPIFLSRHEGFASWLLDSELSKKYNQEKNRPWRSGDYILMEHLKNSSPRDDFIPNGSAIGIRMQYNYKDVGIFILFSNQPNYFAEEDVFPINFLVNHIIIIYNQKKQFILRNSDECKNDKNDNKSEGYGNTRLEIEKHEYQPGDEPELQLTEDLLDKKISSEEYSKKVIKRFGSGYKPWKMMDYDYSLKNKDSKIKDNKH
jgi:hypothetical protein